MLLNNRQKFIKHLKDTYKQASIYNPDIFFGILYDLTDPELYTLACEWLRGDSLSEESMELLKVKYCIDTEDTAKNILANFGKISTDTQPIVLCFDQVETQSNWNSNPQPIFNINTTIHNDNLKNFLIIISIVKDAWKQCASRILQSDKARIERLVALKPINLNQAESLWAYRLQPLHQQADSKTDSPIFPLNKQLLEDNFPGGKTLPRNTLILGRNEYQKHKVSLLNKPDEISIDIIKKTNGNGTIIITPPKPPVDRTQAEFELLWEKEYKKNQEKITKISLLSSPDLIQMMQVSLAALQIQEIKTKLLSGRFASFSLSYQKPGKLERIGIVWTEESHMTSFFNIMNACQRVIQQNLCHTLYLIRIGGVGTPKLAGNQIYQQIFIHTNHHHIKPNLSSVHYLATYQSLVNSALAQELVIAGKTIILQELQNLIREAKILDQCILLQDLGIVSKQPVKPVKDLRKVKDFLLNLVTTQGYMGVPTLISQAVSHFSDIKESEIQHLIDLLCQEKKVKIINPKAKIQDRLICLIAL